MREIDAARAALEIAEFLAEPLPEGAVADLRDLGVIGYAASLSGTTPLQLRELITAARDNGRSWEEIGNRLGMTEAEAEAHHAALDVVKQVIVIRRDLGMRRGKEIAQGAHASMAWLTSRLRQQSFYSGAEDFTLDEGFTLDEKEWMNGSFRKVTLQVRTEEELRAVHRAALDAGIESHLIIDSGLTEFGGEPTATAVGIGPGRASRLDPVTGHLKLY